MKKLFLLFVAMCYMMTFSAYAAKGNCGDHGSNVKWELDNKTGVLTIYGTGKMKTYYYYVHPHSPFRNNKKIKHVIVKEGVTHVGRDAFGGCENLLSVTFPKSLTSMGGDVFYKDYKLNAIYIQDLAGWCSYGGGNQNNDYRLYVDNVEVTDLVIPEGVTKINFGAFRRCVGLQSVTCPSTVEIIDKYAFSGCPNLRSVRLSNSVKAVAENAFKDCKNLKIIYNPSGVSLADANLPAGVKVETQTSKSSAGNPASKPSQPPLLALVDGSLSFHDYSGNNRIDASETSSIRFQVRNNGKGEAYNCEARIRMSGTTNGITVKNVQLPSIGIGQTEEVTIPISSNLNTTDGKVLFTVEVYEPNGWGVAPFDLAVATKSYEPPFLQVVDYQITSESGKVQKMKPFALTFNLQNTRYGIAEDVKVKVVLPAGVFNMDEISELSYPQLRSGEVKSITLNLIANNNVNTAQIPVDITISEKHGKFAENKHVDIAFNQTTSKTITINADDDPQEERKEIQLALMSSDVDRDIPQTGIANNHTFVVIIANENYDQVASVPFALNDGKIFRQYCEQTLGIPAKNIHIETNATGGKIRAQIDWLQDAVNVFKQHNPSVIFYYAGHGIPDEASKSAYLLPVDGIVSNLNTCFKLDELYATLGAMPAERISVFMDACFSGSKRENGMLASARAVALKTRPGEPQGKMVVFSAAQGDETAYPYREKLHGMFTYYLLKKLQETQGNVSLVELGEYVTTHVQQQSVLENSKVQTPCVTPSTAVVDNWRSWTLK